MHPARKFAPPLAALIVALLGSAAALAAPAITTGHANVRQGGSTTSPVLATLPGGASLDATCNAQGWCQIAGTGIYRGVRGWISQSLIAFTDGQTAPQGSSRPPAPRPDSLEGPGLSLDFNWGSPPSPRPPSPRPPVYEVPDYEAPEACFYSGRNFEGSQFCLGAGESYDRLPRPWNDTIRSVEVFGGASVDLCSETGYYGQCVTVDTSVSRLPGGIDRRISSVDVY